MVHDDVDTIYLGLGQRLRAGCLIILYLGWLVNERSKSICLVQCFQETR